MGTYRLLLVGVSSLVAALMITGCASDDGETDDAATPSSTAEPTTPATSPSPTASLSAAVEPAPREISVTIADGEVSPAPDRIQVDEGTAVRILVTSDEHDEIHVHGYDLSAEVDAGGTATIEFDADQTGLFEVESHELGVPLFQLQIQ